MRASVRAMGLFLSLFFFWVDVAKPSPEVVCCTQAGLADRRHGGTAGRAVACCVRCALGARKVGELVQAQDARFRLPLLRYFTCYFYFLRKGHRI